MPNKKKMRLSALLAASLAATSLSWSHLASASEPFIGEIKIVGFNFAPRGYAKCDGQLLPISSNTALFSLLGTMYGGDGRTTFALPDLRGRIAMHSGQGPGLGNVTQGARGGAENVSLSVANMPAHNHLATGLSATLMGNNSSGNSPTPGANSLASKSRTNIYSSANAPDVAMHAGSVTVSGNVANTGGSQSFSIRNPYLGVNYVISLVGIFPS